LFAMIDQPRAQAGMTTGWKQGKSGKSDKLPPLLERSASSESNVWSYLSNWGFNTPRQSNSVADAVIDHHHRHFQSLYSRLSTRTKHTIEVLMTTLSSVIVLDLPLLREQLSMIMFVSALIAGFTVSIAMELDEQEINRYAAFELDTFFGPQAGVCQNLVPWGIATKDQACSVENCSTTYRCLRRVACGDGYSM
jgi:hypothetical protein